ncbi:MAG: phosphoenolpyruvate synthase [Thermoplasmatota archaeon]
MVSMAYVRWFSDITSDDVEVVGGKNASLGEMIHTFSQQDIDVPRGFALTVDAYWTFLDDNGLAGRIERELTRLEQGEQSLERTGQTIRDLFRRASFPDDMAEEVRQAYHELSQFYQVDETDVAVRSSATAEDLPEASFAGQQDTYLNVRGSEAVLEACQKCFASLFTDRAIIYREEHGFSHLQVALSIGIQKMVRSDTAGAGVIFTIDTETGFPHAVVINASWGLGENVVQGSVTPDEYIVCKPLLDSDKLRPIIGKTCGPKTTKMVYTSGEVQSTKTVGTSQEERASFVLTDDEILQLARWAKRIEEHYGRPMDVEWAKDGETGKLYILQARPETVQSRQTGTTLRTYKLTEKGREVVAGLAIGQTVTTGTAQVIKGTGDMHRFQEGSILVTGMTHPDWVPIMKKAAGIITDHGGRTSHAAIVSRELGIPAVVGTDTATEAIQDGQEITLCCAEGERGVIYDGILDFEVETVDIGQIPATHTKVMMNVATPGAAFRWWRLPAQGIGLARMEFIINNIIKVHPLALVHYDRLADTEAKEQIARLTRNYSDKTEYFVSQLARGIGRIAASQYPHPVIVRMSDFKSNEYANLIGGAQFEPTESNPMLGFRGASRYYSQRYREGFALECRAIRCVREELGLDNVIVMIPFCRTVREADLVLAELAANGLRRGDHGLQVYMMAEIPSNVILAGEFAQRFDGFSIGSNDLTQLTLGVDRDSELLSDLFDERDEAVKRMVTLLIERAHRHDCKVGFCGQAPSDHPGFAAFLAGAGIDSVSVNPDSVITVKQQVASAERKQ